jgi:undecaprenyl pyrophosphate phosphatase UppP
MSPFIFASLTYVLMLAAYFLPHRRFFHMPVMSSIILFDIGLPIYLYLHRDWWHRLIDQQEFMSSLVWMHFGLIVSLYWLYWAQINTVKKMITGNSDARNNHRSQGTALLLVRGLMILTGAFLANPT